MLAACALLALTRQAAALSGGRMAGARASLRKARVARTMTATPARRSPRLRGATATPQKRPVTTSAVTPRRRTSHALPSTPPRRRTSHALPSTPPRRPRPALLTTAAKTTRTSVKVFTLPTRDAHDATAAAIRQLDVMTIGVDEVGRGCLAGPVIACACYLPADVDIGVADSKTITSEKKREALFAALQEAPGVRYALAKADAALIDDVNILQANLACMRAAAEALCDRLSSSDDGEDDVMIDVTAVDAVEACGSEEEERIVAIVDGVDDPWRRGPGPRLSRNLGVRTIKGGDALVPCVSAASIIAKVTRDRLMRSLHEAHPAYGWVSNKGYGSKQHRAAIAEVGWVRGLHRESFDPVKSMLLSDE